MQNLLPTKLMRSILIPILLTFASPTLFAQLNVLQSTIVDANALNFSDAASNFSNNINGRTYQRHPVVSLQGYQYTTYYDSDRYVALARRQLPAGSWEVIRFTDYTITSSDSHNVVTLGICAADGTIHLSFDHHPANLNYRVSNQGVATNPESITWSTALFGSVTDNLGSAGQITGLTYPSFFNAPNGNLMFYYRKGGSGNGDGMIHEYDGTTHDWTTGMGEFIASTGTYNGAVSTNSTSRNPYINGISYGGNRLHVSWGWRESAGGSSNNHDLMYTYSDDHGRTWFNSGGTQIGTTNSSFINLNSPGVTVASIPQNIGLSNQYTHYAYDDGSCHVIVAHNISGTSTKAYHHYWRNTAGTWSSEALPFSASRPKLVGDCDRTLYLAYATGSKPSIAKGVPNGSMTSWTWSVIHTQTDTTEGGEGHVDLARWETDRILSYYGQEKGNSAGDPTPLHIYDYQVSAKAILPTPLHLATGVSDTTSLQWTAGIDASMHRIYLGTDPVAVAAANTSSPEYFGEQASTTFTPAAPLAEATVYYWRVDEVDSGSNVHSGLLWSFSTAGNLPPTLTGLSDRTAEVGDPIPDVSLVINDDLTDPNSLTLTASSSNTGLVPNGNLTFSGTGTNRTLAITPLAGQTGTSDITIGVSDGTHLVEDTLTLTITPPKQLIAGWDTWDSATAPSSTVVASGFTASATASTSSGNWNIVDDSSDPGRGSSNDTTWGSFDGDGITASSFTDLGTSNLTVTNGRPSAEVTFTIVNNGPVDFDLDEFHMDVVAFRPNAPRTYALNVLAGSDITVGNVFTSGSLAITHLGGGLSGHDQHDDLNLALTGLADSTLEAGGTAIIQIAFSDGTGSGGGHHLFLDNVAISGIQSSTLTGLESWRFTHFGSTINAGNSADDADPNNDGEENFLEYITAQDPNAATLVETTLSHNGASLEFTYSRSLDAVSDGVIFEVQWSDTLLPESWSSVGVSEFVATQYIDSQDLIATIPTGSGSARFVRLKASQP